MLLDGAMDGNAFQAYVEQVLLPKLSHGDVVVMDNPSRLRLFFAIVPGVIKLRGCLFRLFLLIAGLPGRRGCA